MGWPTDHDTASPPSQSGAFPLSYGQHKMALLEVIETSLLAGQASVIAIRP